METPAMKLPAHRFGADVNAKWGTELWTYQSIGSFYMVSALLDSSL